MDDRGFTLLEIVAIVTIIGILAAFAIPNFGRIRNRAKELSVKTNMRSFQIAIEEFGDLNYGLYPGGPESETSETGEIVKEILKGNKYPQNPFTGKPTKLHWYVEDEVNLPINQDLPPGEIEYISNASQINEADATSYSIHAGNSRMEDSRNINLVLTSD